MKLNKHKRNSSFRSTNEILPQQKKKNKNNLTKNDMASSLNLHLNLAVLSLQNKHKI